MPEKTERAMKVERVRLNIFSVPLLRNEGVVSHLSAKFDRETGDPGMYLKPFRELDESRDGTPFFLKAEMSYGPGSSRGHMTNVDLAKLAAAAVNEGPHNKFIKAHEIGVFGWFRRLGEFPSDDGTYVMAYNETGDVHLKVEAGPKGRWIAGPMSFQDLSGNNTLRYGLDLDARPRTLDLETTFVARASAEEGLNKKIFRAAHESLRKYYEDRGAIVIPQEQE